MQVFIEDVLTLLSTRTVHGRLRQEGDEGRVSQAEGTTWLRRLRQECVCVNMLWACRYVCIYMLLICTHAYKYIDLCPQVMWFTQQPTRLSFSLSSSWHDAGRCQVFTKYLLNERMSEWTLQRKDEKPEAPGVWPSQIKELVKRISDGVFSISFLFTVICGPAAVSAGSWPRPQNPRPTADVLVRHLYRRQTPGDLYAGASRRATAPALRPRRWRWVQEFQGFVLEECGVKVGVGLGSTWRQATGSKLASLS